MHNPHTESAAARSDGPNAEERQWGMFAHLSALAGFVIPFGNIIGPLVIWQIKKNALPFAAQHSG